MIAIDIEMPKNCLDCPIRHYIDNEGNYCDLTGLYNREDDCPLVRIVTCKDCIHNGTMRCKCFMSDRNEYMSYNNPNFYCADGERRE